MPPIDANTSAASPLAPSALAEPPCDAGARAQRAIVAWVAATLATRAAPPPATSLKQLLAVHEEWRRATQALAATLPANPDAAADPGPAPLPPQVLQSLAVMALATECRTGRIARRALAWHAAHARPAPPAAPIAIGPAPTVQ